MSSAPLGQALTEAAALSEQLQRGIELERTQLSDLHQQDLRQARLKELTAKQVEAVAGVLGEQQARGVRRALWRDILIAFVSFAAGYLAPAFLSAETALAQLQRWLRLS